MEYVYSLLENERNRLLETIKNCPHLEQKAELIGNKNLIESSLALLKKCDDFGIYSKSIFTKLPDTICQSPSSEYRIVEDFEGEDSTYWQEVKIEGKHFNCVRLRPGDVVIEV